MDMKDDSKRVNKWSIFGSLGAALATVVCCLGPLVLVSLGVTGSWIGNLSALEPYRPLFMVVAAGLLGFGFYRVYGRSNEQDCGEGSECEVPRANRINQVSLWIATVVVVALFASPHLLGVGVGGASSEQPTTATVGSEKSADQSQANAPDTATVTFVVEKMTCNGCALSIQRVLTGIDGVQEATVSFEPPQAVVTYEPSRVSIQELTAATAEIGYPSKPQR